MTFLAIIGKKYCDADTSDVPTEAESVASGPISGVLKGYYYN